MNRFSAPFVILSFLIAAFSGCYRGTARNFDPRELLVENSGWSFVSGVPLIRQSSDRDCGAAALAMALSYWGVDTSTEDVLAATSPSAGHGIQAGMLRDFARAHGLDAFVVKGQLLDVQLELERRRPVIVGLVKRFTKGVTTHYEVVVGINAHQQRIATLDPALGWRENSWTGFSSEWAPAQQLTLVLFRPPITNALR